MPLRRLILPDGGVVDLLPGEVPPLSWQGPAPGGPVLTLDAALLRVVAARALAAGRGGQAAVGVAAAQHGEGTTTVARGLAACLTQHFGKRVVLVEANERSPCLRQIYRLVDGPGLSDVLGRRVSLGGALQMAGEDRRMLILPASLPNGVYGQGGHVPGLVAAHPAGQTGPASHGLVLRDLVAALLGHADTVVIDLAPVLPYRDSPLLGPAMDGVALVLRGGQASRAEAAQAVQAMRDGGAPVLGAVLNRYRSPVPRFLKRIL
jgi:Mrp family chromosome partitioning ATPase